MTADELVVMVPFMRVRCGLRVKFHPPGQGGHGAQAATPMAKSLALGHALDRALTAGGPGTLDRLAASWGIRPQRLALVHVLTYLAPDLQERVLFSSSDTGRLIFPDLVAIARIPLWANQRVAWDQILNAKGAGPKSLSGGKRGTSNTEGLNPAPKGSENGRTQVSQGGSVVPPAHSSRSAKNAAPEPNLVR